MEKTPEFKGSSAAASQVVQYFITNRQENKIKGYQQRLANTLISKDYGRFIEIMLQLSSYTEVPFVFIHKLLLLCIFVITVLCHILTFLYPYIQVYYTVSTIILSINTLV